MLSAWLSAYAPPGMIQAAVYEDPPLFASEIRPADGQSISQHPDGMPGWPSWTPARHVELMEEWGIATALLSISSPGTHSATMPPGDTSART